MTKGNQKKQYAKSVRDNTFDPSDYDSNLKANEGMAITHEQVSDAYMEGTIDGSMDDVSENGELRSHRGKKIKREGFSE
jgi:hypothetical protein